MNTRITLLLLIAALSCAKSPNGFDPFVQKSLDSVHVYNQVEIIYDDVISPPDSEIFSTFNIMGGATFTDSLNGAAGAVQGVSIDSVPLAYANGAYSYDFTENYLATSKVRAGKAASVTIAGSSDADTLTDSIYIAADLGPSLWGYPTSQVVSFAHSMDLTWIPDARASQLTVYIQLYYAPGLSKQTDSTAPASLKGLFYTTTDNGSFSIPAKDLATLPLKTWWNMSVERYYSGQGKLPYSNRRVFFEGTSQVLLVPFMIGYPVGRPLRRPFWPL